MITVTGMMARPSTRLHIRPIGPADQDGLAGAFARLSVRSRWLRFLMAKPRLTAAELRYFTSVDHHDHEALVAVDPADCAVVGVARYVRSAQDRHAAEIAVTVVDDWQGRGLGSLLLSRLATRAREEGVDRFLAVVSADNLVARRLLAAPGVGARLVGTESGVQEYELPVRALHGPSRPRRAHSFRWAAATAPSCASSSTR